jgi:hypothetical protein
MMGISTLAYGLFYLVYLVTAYMDITYSQFHHSSVRVHVILAGVAAIRLLRGI